MTTKRIISVLLATLLVLIAAFTLSLAITHLFGTIERIISFMTEYEFDWRDYHCNPNQCIFHYHHRDVVFVQGPNYEQDVASYQKQLHNELIIYNLYGYASGFVLKVPFLCFVAHMFWGLSSLFTKFILVGVFFGLAIMVLSYEKTKVWKIIKLASSIFTALGLALFALTHLLKLFIKLCVFIRVVWSTVFGKVISDFEDFVYYLFEIIGSQRNVGILVYTLLVVFALCCAAAVVICLFVKTKAPNKEAQIKIENQRIEKKAQSLQKKLQKLEKSLSVVSNAEAEKKE